MSQPSSDSQWHCIRSLTSGQILCLDGIKGMGVGPVLLFRSREEAEEEIIGICTSDPSGMWFVEPLPADSFRSAVAKPITSTDHRDVAACFTLKNAENAVFKFHLAADPRTLANKHAFDELLNMVETFLSQITSSHEIIDRHLVTLVPEETK